MVELVLLGLEISQLLAEVALRVALVRGATGTAPLNIIFGDFAQQADALEHVGDVVDAPLLHGQRHRRLVQVQDAVLGRLQ